MIDLIPWEDVADKPLLQQEVSAHCICDDSRDIGIDEFHEGVASRASRLGRAGDAAAIDATELVEKGGDLTLLESDGEMSEVDDRGWILAIVGRGRLLGRSGIILLALLSFAGAPLALGRAFRGYRLGMFAVYLTLAVSIFRIFILGW